VASWETVSTTGAPEYCFISEARMSFDAEIRQWRTLGDFVEHLATVPKPEWVRRITNHNTYKPNELTWRGLVSMNSMMETYKAKIPPWSAGPHLYLAAEAPNSADRGIWQMTPLAHPGVHAGPCNEDALGVEWVGDFQARRPSAAQYQLGLDVNVAICRAWGLTAANVNVHKECMPGRTCPGQYLPADELRATIAVALRDVWAAWGTAFPLPPEQRGWGIPQLWLQNAGALGAARSYETYVDANTSMQTFQGGMIIYEKLADRTSLLRRVRRIA